MQKNYKIEVDCANCANLMEINAKKVKGIEDVSISFMTQKMRVSFSEDCDEKKVMKEVLKVCRKIEPDCEIETE